MPCVEPVDQALHLRHYFGADAVAGEKQQFMGRHVVYLQLVMARFGPAIHVLLRSADDMDARHKAGHDGECEIRAEC